MEPLRRFSLSHDRAKDDWKLVNDLTDQVIRRFDTKAEGTTGGVLGDALGSQGGSVRIHLENGLLDEERTFPGTRDPKRSPG